MLFRPLYCRTIHRQQPEIYYSIWIFILFKLLNCIRLIINPRQTHSANLTLQQPHAPHQEPKTQTHRIEYTLVYSWYYCKQIWVCFSPEILDGHYLVDRKTYGVEVSSKLPLLAHVFLHQANQK